jgi:acetyltransferase-like isoleucine patch superfamily enzyme
MEIPSNPPGTIVPAVHGRQTVEPDPRHEIEWAEALRATHTVAHLAELLARYSTGDGAFDRTIRKVLWCAAAKRVGHGLKVGTGVGVTHLERIEIGSGVFIGGQSFLQGWYAGTFVIGDNVWIGPQSYFDARNLVLEDYVGWGPGAKALCSQHAGDVTDVPVVQTDLAIKPIRVEQWADIGTNAVLLPGVTVGKGAIVGAGAVVNQDVAPFSVVAGVPARFLRWRNAADPHSAIQNATKESSS